MQLCMHANDSYNNPGSEKKAIIIPFVTVPNGMIHFLEEKYTAPAPVSILSSTAEAYQYFTNDPSSHYAAEILPTNS